MLSMVQPLSAARLEHRVVLGQLRGHAGLPANAPPPEGAHDLLRTLLRAEEVRVVERDHPRAAHLDLANDLFHRPVAELQAVHQGFGAERAPLMTPAGSLHERAVDVAMLLEEVVPGQRQVFHREQPSDL
jgi:hypothetical protein